MLTVKPLTDVPCAKLWQAVFFLAIAALLPLCAFAAPSAKNPEAGYTQSPASDSIAVIYPDIGEPYRSVFTQIITGIQEKTRMHIAEFAVGSNTDSAEISANLHRKDTRVVIALGRQGAKLAASLDDSFRVVIGGVVSNQESKSRNFRVNTLSPDPALLFARLKEIMPKARRIYTVYDSRQNAWMIHLAKEAARAQDIEFIAIEAQDLRSAISAYRKIIADSDSVRDAIWLLQDSTTVEEGTILPMVLRASWDHNLAVFSSTSGHVRQGALFSLYPDNIKLGRQLADSALDMLNSNNSEPATILPLRATLISVNLRTAMHIGLNIGRPQNFDMVFPEH